MTMTEAHRADCRCPTCFRLTTPPRRGLDRPASEPPRESDSQLLLSIRNLLRTILVIWLVLLAFGGIVGYTTWQQARCEESSIYSSDC